MTIMLDYLSLLYKEPCPRQSFIEAKSEELLQKNHKKNMGMKLLGILLYVGLFITTSTVPMNTGGHLHHYYRLR